MVMIIKHQRNVLSAFLAEDATNSDQTCGVVRHKRGRPLCAANGEMSGSRIDLNQNDPNRSLSNFAGGWAPAARYRRQLSVLE
jgi:hypothetical protein